MKNIFTFLCGLCFCLNTMMYSQPTTVGLIQHSSGSLDNGYVFFAPIRSDTTYLIDKCGKRVHEWTSNRTPGLSAYLLEDGSILRTEVVVSSVFSGAGAAGGKMQRIDWDGNVVWQYTISDTGQTQNHDVYPMPNGNILVAIWTNVSAAQALASGRNPAILGTNLWSAKIVELQPVGAASANIVWQWDLWDHLVQEFDSAKINYGVVANHPELLNLNFNGTSAAAAIDWIHLNAVTYNVDLDEVMFSSHNLSEIYIIDHSTTTAEAASHAGGTHGKGGDFLYRWGNAQAYNRGTVADRKLFLQHNPTWIPQGFKDAGKIMIFNNGNGRPGGNASSVDIISQPVDSAGDYTLLSGQPYGPDTLDWTYMDVVPANFYAQSMGGAQPLSNGNTIIDEATTGNFFEVDSMGTIVWQYINPVSSTGPIAQGTTSATTQVFRCVFYPDTYAAFAGHVLTPGNPIELNPNPYTCDLTIGMNEIKSEPMINVFPNPVSDNLTLVMPEGVTKIEIKIFNMLGELLYSSFTSKQKIEIDVTLLTEGMYIIQASTADTISRKKFVKH